MLFPFPGHTVVAPVGSALQCVPLTRWAPSRLSQVLQDMGLPTGVELKTTDPVKSDDVAANDAEPNPLATPTVAADPSAAGTANSEAADLAEVRLRFRDLIPGCSLDPFSHEARYEVAPVGSQGVPALVENLEGYYSSCTVFTVGILQ